MVFRFDTLQIACNISIPFENSSKLDCARREERCTHATIAAPGTGLTKSAAKNDVDPRIGARIFRVTIVPGVVARYAHLTPWHRARQSARTVRRWMRFWPSRWPPAAKWCKRWRAIDCEGARARERKREVRSTKKEKTFARNFTPLWCNIVVVIGREGSRIRGIVFFFSFYRRLKVLPLVKSNCATSDAILRVFPANSRVFDESQWLNAALQERLVGSRNAHQSRWTIIGRDYAANARRNGSLLTALFPHLLHHFLFSSLFIDLKYIPISF